MATSRPWPRSSCAPPHIMTLRDFGDGRRDSPAGLVPRWGGNHVTLAGVNGETSDVYHVGAVVVVPCCLLASGGVSGFGGFIDVGSALAILCVVGLLGGW